MKEKGNIITKSKYGVQDYIYRDGVIQSSQGNGVRSIVKSEE